MQKTDTNASIPVCSYQRLDHAHSVLSHQVNTATHIDYAVSLCLVQQVVYCDVHPCSSDTSTNIEYTKSVKYLVCVMHHYIKCSAMNGPQPPPNQTNK